MDLKHTITVFRVAGKIDREHIYSLITSKIDWNESLEEVTGKDKFVGCIIYRLKLAAMIGFDFVAIIHSTDECQ